MKRDWYFSNDNKICNYRVAGILIKNGKILVQRERDSDEYALPGGHVIIGETSEQSLIREFKEETGADISCSRLIWIEECFWKWGGKDTHTISFYWLVNLDIGSDIPDISMQSQKDNCNVILEWVTLDSLCDLTIYPDFVKEKATNISNNIEHFVR